MWFDPVSIDALVDLVPPWLALLLALLSFLGSAIVLIPLVLGWYAVRPRERVLSTAGALFAAFAVRGFLKELNEIERPVAQPDFDPAILPWFVEPLYTHPVGIETTGFPSGHMVAATVFWGVLAVDIDVGDRGSRLAALAGVIAVVAMTRVLLGAHWIEDVIVGFLVGVVLLATYLWGRSRLGDEVTFAFGLTGAIASADLLVAGSPSGQATFAASWGVFAGLWLRYRVGWPSTSPLAQRPGRRPALAAISGCVILALAFVVNPPTEPALLAIAPVASLAIHWHPDRVPGLPITGPASTRR